MENAWMLMMSMSQSDKLPRSVPKGTLPRIWRFASAHHRMLYGFLALTTVSAVIAVGVPVRVHHPRRPVAAPRVS